MAQTLLLGLGGTGSEIVNNVAAELKKRRIQINDGQICCAVLDTNDNDREKIINTGVGIPVIPTSKTRNVASYLQMYSNKGVRNWMPESPALLKESMKDGASQMRSKSRLALMDILEDRTIRQLEIYIEKLFDKRDDTKIRVMIVSSLAGGTGSGMFIQTALWLRKYFAKRKCPITIRGIFVLPDVFISTLKDIREDPTEIQSLYANAYGAIRELNAITKIKTKGMRPQMPVKIDNLFDSEKGQPDGQPVYDYAFFVDDISEGGSVLTKLEHYEQVVARLVYMQLYAPMHNDLYSEEDNLFKRFQKSPDPVFGACGTAKAVYPSDDILRYCALRATQDSLSTGWCAIDEEIKAKQAKEDEKEANGVTLTHRLNPRKEYVRLFEAKSSKTGTQVGKDRLFVNIAHDVDNEHRDDNGEGELEVSHTDKVDDFLEKLDEIIARTVDTTNPGNLRSIRVQEAWKKATSDTTDKLIDFVTKKEKAVKNFLTETETNVPAMADEVLDLVCAANMGDVNQDNLESVYGMFTKKNKDKETVFVHPIAVRCILYKLASRLDELKQSIDVDKARSSAQKGHGSGKKKVNFDNAKTRGVAEDGPLGYLESRKKNQDVNDFLETFKSLYVQHNNGQFELCRTYAIAAVKLHLVIALSQRVEKLIKLVEEFFGDMNKVSNTVEDEIAKNIRKNNQIAQKILYVCAAEEDKEGLYQSLSFDTDQSESNLNRAVVNAIYGKLCAQEYPKAKHNLPYLDVSVNSIFFKQAVATYSKLILEKKKKEIDLDIYSAVCKSADIAFEKEKEMAKEAESQESERLDVSLDEDEVSAADARHARHVRAMEDLMKRLMDLGAPFLITNDEVPEDSDEHVNDDGTLDPEPEEFMPIRKRKTFWGIHPKVVELCPELGEMMGVKVESQQHRAYARNELDCYRAVYGIQAGHVPDFNELEGGDFFKSYRQVVRGMIAGVGAGDDTALVHTPHLDKTWHLFLPYITPEKQRLEDETFYRQFWLALAYGMITLDNKGKYQIKRTKKTATGSYDKFEPVLYNGAPVGKVDVPKLLAALRLDGSFSVDAALQEKKFRKECDELVSYESTVFLRGETYKEDGDGDSKAKKVTVGGLGSKLDHNAVTVIVRYHNSPKHNDDVTAMLIQSLEKLCSELVSFNYDADEDDKVELKGYEICKRIYTASAMKDKDIELLKHWKRAGSGKKMED